MRTRDLKPGDADEPDEVELPQIPVDPEWILELERDRTIDPENLDGECVNQAELYVKWADRFVDADWVYELKTLRLDNIESELQILCRADPDKFGIHVKTVTEALVKAGIRQAKEYRRAYRGQLKARKKKLWLQHVLSALDMKKRMLETLTTLHGQEYFAGPQIPHDLATVWKRSREKITGTKMAALARKVNVKGDQEDGEEDDG